MPVVEARRENFPSMRGVEKPGMPRSTMKPRILLPSSTHFAQTTATSAMGLFVIQVLLPFKMYTPSLALYLAFVSMPAGSLPWFGSVRPKQPTSSPFAVKTKLVK